MSLPFSKNIPKPNKRVIVPTQPLPICYPYSNSPYHFIPQQPIHKQMNEINHNKIKQMLEIIIMNQKKHIDDQQKENIDAKLSVQQKENIDAKLSVKLSEIKAKLWLTDNNTLSNNTQINQFTQKYSKISKKNDDRVNNKLNILNQNQNNILTQIIDQNDVNSEQFKLMQNELNQFVTKQIKINNELHQYLERKQKEENENKELENNEQEQLRLWLQNIIKLPQYFSNFIDNGFESISSASNVNMFVLEMIGINKIGHKIEILKQCGKYRDNHPDSSYIHGVTEYYKNPKNIEIEKLSKIYKENENKLRNEYQDSLKQLIKLDYSSKDDIDIYWRKGEILKEYVLSQFNERRRKEKLKDRFIVETNSNDTDYGPEYGPYIHHYLEMNETNSFDPLLLNYVSSSKSPQKIKQSKVIEKVLIENHPRIKGLNGEYGVRSLIKIGKNTVIGEYNAKYLLQSDLHRINNEEVINQIDSYGFDAIIETSMTDTQWNAFNNNQHIVNNISQPPMKRRKLNNYNMKNKDNNIMPFKIDVIADGFSFEPRCILTYINDCRQTFVSNQATEQDKKYYNIKLITVDINGWPRVFGIALRDIAQYEELSCFYGENFIDVQNKKIKLKQRKQKILKILYKHGMKIDM